MNPLFRAAALLLAVASSVALAADVVPTPAPEPPSARGAALSAQRSAAPAPEVAASESAPAPAADVVPASATAATPSMAAPPAAADDELVDDSFAAAGSDGSAEPESMLGTLWKMFLSLGIVIALVYVSLNYGLRKLMGVRGAMLGRASLVKVVERIPLDPKRTLFVIEAAGEYLLVGGADQNLSLISKLSPEEVQKLLAQRQTAAAQKPSPFLQKLLARPASAQAPTAPANEPPRTEDP